MCAGEEEGGAAEQRHRAWLWFEHRAFSQPPAWPLRESAGAKHFAFLESSDKERDHAFTELGFASLAPPSLMLCGARCCLKRTFPSTSGLLAPAAQALPSWLLQLVMHHVQCCESVYRDALAYCILTPVPSQVWARVFP